MSNNCPFSPNSDSVYKKHSDLDYTISKSTSNKNSHSSDDKHEYKIKIPTYAKPLNLETGLKYKSVKDLDYKKSDKYEIAELYNGNFLRVRGVFTKKSQHMHGHVVFFKVRFFNKYPFFIKLHRY